VRRRSFQEEGEGNRRQRGRNGPHRGGRQLKMVFWKGGMSPTLHDVQKWEGVNDRGKTNTSIKGGRTLTRRALGVQTRRLFYKDSPSRLAQDISKGEVKQRQEKKTPANGSAVGSALIL